MFGRALRRLFPGVSTASVTRSSPPSQVTSKTTATGSREGPLDVCLLSYRGNPYSGGQGVYVKYLSRALTNLGHSVDVISGKPYPELDPEVTLIELPGENLFEEPSRLRAFEPSYLRSPTKLFEWASVLTGGFPEPYTFGRRVVQYFEEHEPSYDIVHDNQSLCYGLLELREMGEPLVTTIHHPITVDRECDLEHADDLLTRLLIRRWYRFLSMQKTVVRNLSHVITVSHAAKRRTVSDFGVEPTVVDVVHNGIDTEQFAPRPDVPTRPNRLMSTVSSSISLKGTRYLLEAFAHVRASNPETELVLVGGLDDTADELASSLGVAEAITTYTEISYDRMVELYASASVAIVPSLFEGFGLPAGEAMACGVPVVTTTGGGLSEVVGDAGILVPPEDPDALADAVGELLEDQKERRRLGSRGRERVRSDFDWEQAAKETVERYREAIANADD